MDQIDDTPDQTTDSNRTDFRAELSSLLNRHSMENGSDTPDFLLAEYMADCLDAFDRMMTKRASWYAPEPKAANAPHEGPGAASSRTVPLDAVVGGQKSALTGRQ